VTDIAIAFACGLILGGLPHAAQAASVAAGVVLTFLAVASR